MTGKFHILYDSDAGSSGKGAAITRLADLLNINNCSCNHGTNAGHFIERGNGERYLFKALPSPASLSWIGKKSYPDLWIGPNSVFELDQIQKEISDMGYGNKSSKIHIHGRAAICEQHHKDAEGPNGKMSTLHISSTMSGAGAAYAMKAMRQLDTRLAEECPELRFYTYKAEMFYWILQDILNYNDFLHEVAQGFALSLDYGMQTRHCTYRNPTAQQAAADMGINPNQIGEVYANLRSFPIRVGNNFDAAGNRVGYSGDWYSDQIELDWQTIGKNAGMPQEEIDLLLKRELTSVTKKLRRVATFSMQSLRYSTAFNGATKLILNFTNYLDWNSLGKRGGRSEFKNLSPKIRDFVNKLETESGLPVVMLGTGAAHDDFILPYDNLTGP